MAGGIENDAGNERKIDSAFVTGARAMMRFQNAKCAVREFCFIFAGEQLEVFFIAHPRDDNFFSSTIFLENLMRIDLIFF